MTNQEAHNEQIKSQFATMQTKDEFVELLNVAKNLLYGKEFNPIKLKSLTYYANPNICKKRYTTFSIRKKSGAERTINAPVKGLKSILRSLNYVLQCMHEPHKAATGFVPNKSIVTNAQKHIGKNYVLNIDLKDFFHSFDRNRVKLAFMYEPFNLRNERESLAFLLACLCTHPIEVNGEQKIVLPQGSPTSPTFTNILCHRLDRRLNGLAKRFGATYTRYADDITFSSMHNIYNEEVNPKKNAKKQFDNFMAELKRLIAEEHLEINPDKTRLQKPAHRQEVTGLTVNSRVNVTRRYVKQIRMYLYYWEKYGYHKAEELFRKDYALDKGHVKKGIPTLTNVLDGKLEYLKMVRESSDTVYVSLKKRFDNLDAKTNPIDEILNVWETEGIESAMQLYYPKEESTVKQSITSYKIIGTI